MPFEEVTIGPCRLIRGDCLEVLPTLGIVDAVVTDPPYGVKFDGKNTKHTTRSDCGYVGGDNELGPVAVAKALEFSKRGVVFPGNRLLFNYPKPYEIGCVYCPSGAGLGRWGFTVSHPVLFYGVGTVHARQSPAGIQSFDTADDNGHPCPKPLRWMEWAVSKCSDQWQMILDPFMGSGTTGVACLNLSRSFVGIEIDPRYFDIACRRIEEAWGKGSLFDDERKPAAELFAGVA